MRSVLLALLVALAFPSLASAQLNGPLMKAGASGAQVTPGAPFWWLAGAVAGDVSCAYDAASASDKCVFAGGSSATLQSAYNASNGVVPSIGLTTAGGAVTIRDASPSLSGTLFSVSNNAGTTKWLDITSTGATTVDSAGALNLGTTNATIVQLATTTTDTVPLGGFAPTSYHAVSDTNYTVDSVIHDFTVEYTTKTLARTVTLPNPVSGNKGRIIFVKNNTTDTNGLSITSAANSIDGATTQTTSTARGWFMVISTGSAWLIMSKN
jgi:hypothetical protein